MFALMVVGRVIYCEGGMRGLLWKEEAVFCDMWQQGVWESLYCLLFVVVECIPYSLF